MISRSEASGFTLAEMLVVLAVMALVSATALQTSWRPQLPARQLASLAHRLASDLRAARIGAIREGRIAGVSIDLDGHRYVRWPSLSEQKIPDEINVRVAIGADARTDLSDVVDIVFDPDGGTSGADITLSAQGQSEQIKLDWLTGHVSVLP